MVGPVNNKHRAPTNRLKLYVRAVIKSEAWPIVVQLKRKIAINCDWVQNEACWLLHDIHVVSHSLITFIIFLKWSLKLGCLTFFLIYKLNCHKIQVLICLVAEESSANIVFKIQLWVSVIKFRKSFTGFMVLMTLFKELESQYCFLLLKSSTCKQTLAKWISYKCIHHRKGSEEHLHQQMEN